MEGTEKPHTGICKDIMKDWNHAASCMLTSPLISFLISAAQSIQKKNIF
jgi:hypothetical protein